MATCYETVKLIHDWHLKSLNAKEKKFIKDVYEGLSGLGNINDNDVKDYITTGQEIFIRAIGKRFMITSKTKI